MHPARADEPGVVVVFELDSVAEARRYVDGFPLTTGLPQQRPAWTMHTA